MVTYIREGNIVLVTESDRLGRNNQVLTKIMSTIQNKGATLDALNLPSMTGIADPNLCQLMTNLIIELYKYQAESERKRIIERQKQGIALAKQQGKYHGRKPRYTKDDPRLLHAFKLYQAGMSEVPQKVRHLINFNYLRPVSDMQSEAGLLFSMKYAHD